MNTKCFFVGLAIWTIIFVPIGFAEDFQNRPSLAELNEVVNQAIECGKAVIERDTVVSRNENFFPYCGHGQSYFASLQHEMEEHLPSLYVDHISGPLNAGETGFLYFTLATWREAAGLNTNGFRRTTEQGSNTYGLAQAGDVIGSWIYEDIEAGFSALKWTMVNCVVYEKAIKYVMGGNASEWWRDGWAECVANWPTGTWESGAWFNDWYVSVEFSNYESYTGKYKAVWATRIRLKHQITFGTGLPDRYLDVYIYGTKVDTGNYAYWDFEEIGTPPYKLYFSDIFSSGTEYISDWLGNIETCPASIFTQDMAPETNYKWPSFIGSEIYLAKWDFTYQDD